MAITATRIVETEGGKTFKLTLVVTPGFLGVYGGPPDAWEPPEGPDVDSEEVELVREDGSLETHSMAGFIEAIGGEDAYEKLVNDILEDME